MPRKQIIAKYSGRGAPEYYTKNPKFLFDGNIESAYFFNEGEADRAITKLCQVFPGYIWEVKTVYHV